MLRRHPQRPSGEASETSLPPPAGQPIPDFYPYVSKSFIPFLIIIFIGFYGLISVPPAPHLPGFLLCRLFSGCTDSIISLPPPVFQEQLTYLLTFGKKSSDNSACGYKFLPFLCFPASLCTKKPPCLFRQRDFSSLTFYPEGKRFCVPLTGQRPQPSGHPRGRCSPTSRPDPRGPCGRRQPACGRWACAGRVRG